MKSAPIMAYRVDLTERAAGDLRRIYRTINAEDGARARAWFNELGWYQRKIDLLAGHADNLR